MWQWSGNEAAESLPSCQCVDGFQAALTIGFILRGFPQPLDLVKRVGVDAMKHHVSLGGGDIAAHQLLPEFVVAASHVVMRGGLVAWIDNVVQDWSQGYEGTGYGCHGAILGEDAGEGCRAADQRYKAEAGAQASVKACVQGGESHVVVDVCLDDVGISDAHDLSPAARFGITCLAVLASMGWSVGRLSAYLTGRQWLLVLVCLVSAVSRPLSLSWLPRCVSGWFGDLILACRQGAAIYCVEVA